MPENDFNTKPLTPLAGEPFPFDWVVHDDLRASAANRLEIYAESDDDYHFDLLALVEKVVRHFDAPLHIYSSYWWLECLDVWNVEDNTYEFDRKSLSIQTRAYLALLSLSGVKVDFKGLCLCNDSRLVSQIIFECVRFHVIPFCPKYLIPSKGILYYMHHTYSIGFYYKDDTEEVRALLNEIEADSSKYEIRL